MVAYMILKTLNLEAIRPLTVPLLLFSKGRLVFFYRTSKSVLGESLRIACASIHYRVINQ